MTQNNIGESLPPASTRAGQECKPCSSDSRYASSSTGSSVGCKCIENKTVKSISIVVIDYMRGRGINTGSACV